MPTPTKQSSITAKAVASSRVNKTVKDNKIMDTTNMDIPEVDNTVDADVDFTSQLSPEEKEAAEASIAFEKAGVLRHARGISDEDYAAATKRSLVSDTGVYETDPNKYNYTGDDAPLLPAKIDLSNLRALKDGRPDHWIDLESRTVYAMPRGWTPKHGKTPKTITVKDKLQGGSFMERAALDPNPTGAKGK